jgi:hypothetical protein
MDEEHCRTSLNLSCRLFALYFRFRFAIDNNCFPMIWYSILLRSLIPPLCDRIFLIHCVHSIFSYSEVLCIMTFHFVLATSQSIVFICLVFSIQLFFITWYKVYHLLFIISLYQSIIFKTFCWEGLILECDSFATSAGYEEVYRGKRDFSLGPKTGSNFCK